MKMSQRKRRTGQPTPTEQPAEQVPVANESLATLTAQIKADLKAVDEAVEESEWLRLRRYHAAGEKLIKAKKLCTHGTWAKWLKENFRLTERRAQQHMKYAKCEVTSDLQEEKEKWRRCSGNGKLPKRSSQPTNPDLPDDGSRLIGELEPLPKAVADEMDTKIPALLSAFGQDHELLAGTEALHGIIIGIIAAVRYAYKGMCCADQ